MRSQPILCCQACPKRQKECHGPCACTVDGVDIMEHARSGKCPEGRFDLPVQTSADAAPCDSCGGEGAVDAIKRATTQAGAAGAEAAALGF